MDNIALLKKLAIKMVAIKRQIAIQVEVHVRSQYYK